jgi:hypothetical protein
MRLFITNNKFIETSLLITKNENILFYFAGLESILDIFQNEDLDEFNMMGLLDLK